MATGAKEKGQYNHDENCAQAQGKVSQLPTTPAPIEAASAEEKDKKEDDQQRIRCHGSLCCLERGCDLRIEEKPAGTRRPWLFRGNAKEGVASLLSATGRSRHCGGLRGVGSGKRGSL
jgi:hypothetical protein